MVNRNKKVLVVGGGGRCHAIVDALSRSQQVSHIYCAPGNAGIAMHKSAENVAIKDSDIAGLKAFALENGIDLTVVGPEAALAKGIVDEFRAAGLKIFGHTAAATRIESSKEFAKRLMEKYDIPSASYRSFTDYEQAVEYVASRPFPAVLKYDGLAAGKGVVIAENLEEARTALSDMLLNSAFSSSDTADKVVVEDFLTGPEFSFMCFVKGGEVFPMPLSQDHKRAYDGDKGPNTGGMGAYTGLPFITEEDKQFAYTNIMCKAASAMVSEGLPLSGVLYGGLMKTPQGIKVIEFNARFGDPETEVVLPLLKSDIYDIFSYIADKCPTGSDDRLLLDENCLECSPALKLVWKDEVTMGVVMASKGYPAHYEKGFAIEGEVPEGICVYHMGTAMKDGRLVTAGGRVMMVVASAGTIASAKEKVYKAVSGIKCSNLFYRSDIAHWAFEK